MRIALKLSVAISAVVLAISLVACGGGGNGDSSSATSTPAPSARQTAKSQPGVKESAETAGRSGGKETGGKPSEPKQNSVGSNTGKKQRGPTVPPYRGPSATAFVPKHHNDSRGGSEQFSFGKDFTSIPDFGSEADSSEFDEVAAAFHNFMDARAEGNWAAMCGYFAGNLRASLAQFVGFRDATAADCPALVEALGAYPPQLPFFEREAEKAEVASVRIDGDRAFVIYWGTEGNVYAWPMAQEADGWKVGAIGPEPICLQSTITSCPRP